MVFLIWEMCLISTNYKLLYPSWCGYCSHNYLITQGNNLLPFYFTAYASNLICKTCFIITSLFFVLRQCEFWPFGLVFSMWRYRKPLNSAYKRFPRWFGWSFWQLSPFSFTRWLKEYVKYPFSVDIAPTNPENAAVCRKSTGSKFALLHDLVVN